MYPMLDDQHITTDPEQLQSLMLARQQIELLRRAYAFATDQLGQVDDADAQTSGLRIYHRIFAPNAGAKVTRGDETLLSATGPDGWAEVARNALRDYAATQHLIGTQLVTFDQAQFDQATLVSGTADMTSYVQATHVWPDQRMRVVTGAYVDHVQWVPGTGWQIDNMNLVYANEEFRQPAE